MVTFTIKYNLISGKELLSKLRKACESLSATIYPIDASADKRREDALEVISRLEDLKHVLDGTKTAMRSELLKVPTPLYNLSI
jgi:V-type H+-transporting ATPase subunit a